MTHINADKAHHNVGPKHINNHEGHTYTKNALPLHRTIPAAMFLPPHPTMDYGYGPTISTRFHFPTTLQPFENFATV
jgi:hypothetical protein